MKLLLVLCLLPLACEGWVKEMENNGLYQGDMVLSPEQQMEASDGRFAFGSVRTGLWPKVNGHVTIPYVMASQLANSRKASGAIQSAINDYHKYTCLRFVARTNERAYIYFKTGSGCSSPVGRTGRANQVTLSSGCWARSTVIHEIGHSIGFHHEQSRPDRDGYLAIRWENIPDRLEYNFKKQSTSRVDSLGTPYDYRSVMHYGKTAFGSGRVTMEAKNKYFQDLIGTGSGFSDADVKQINLLYKCPAYNATVNSRLSTPDCHDSSSYCEMQVMDRGCARMKRSCPFTCNACTVPGGHTDPVPTNYPIPSGGPVTQGPPPSDCKDKLTTCARFDSMCKSTNAKWLEYMKNACARTCGFCTGPAPPPTPFECEDLANNCAQTNDQCHNAAVASVCKKTCGVCV